MRVRFALVLGAAVVGAGAVGASGCSIFAIGDDLIGGETGAKPGDDGGVSGPPGASMDGAAADAAPAPGGPSACGADLLTDPAHCGECGRSCAGAACLEGVCATETIAQGVANLGGVAASARHVVWTTGIGAVAFDRATGTTSPLSTVTSGSFAREVTWSGIAFALATNSGSAGRTSRCVPGEECRFPMNSLPNAYVTVDDGTAQFTTTRLGIRGCDSGGCGDAYRILVGETEGPFVDMTMLGARLYWVTGESPGRVRTVLKSAAGASGTDVATGQASPKGIAADATGLTWTAYDSGQVLRCALGASGVCASPPSVIYRGAGTDAPGRVASDGAHVYWITEGTPRVLRCPVTGCVGAPVVVMRDLTQPRRLALAADRVYVADWATGRVISAPK